MDNCRRSQHSCPVVSSKPESEDWCHRAGQPVMQALPVCIHQLKQQKLIDIDYTQYTHIFIIAWVNVYHVSYLYLCSSAALRVEADQVTYHWWPSVPCTKSIVDVALVQWSLVDLSLVRALNHDSNQHFYMVHTHNDGFAGVKPCYWANKKETWSGDRIHSSVQKWQKSSCVIIKSMGAVNTKKWRILWGGKLFRREKGEKLNNQMTTNVLSMLWCIVKGIVNFCELLSN